jgi:hypothetical protein
MEAESRKLERSSVEAYAGFGIGIALAVIHMTWQWKVLAFIVLASLSIDLAYRSPWTHRWSVRYRTCAAIIGVLIIMSLGYNPVVDQYREDHKSTSAHFRVFLTGLRTCVWPPPFPVNSVAILVWAAVENTGAPSVAKRWSLTIDIPGQPTILTEPMHYSDGGAACGEQFNSNEALEDKTENKEVDGVVHGKLLFLSTGIPSKEITQDDVILTLRVMDKDNTIYPESKRIAAIGPRLINPQPTSPLIVTLPDTLRGK